MGTSISLAFQYIRAFILIYLCLFAGNAISSLLPLTIPGSIIGMLILFGLLSTQILPFKWVKPGCNILIRYMALLFVPIGVGVMNYYAQLRTQFGPLVVSCLVSTLVVLLVVAYCSHYIHGERGVVTDKGEDKND
ncbi:CidA/LrgA family protein [Rahnella sp. C60]|jgi:holin-like protein|uniref:UPF0299 membrane protein J1786_00450 n=1 Tax=Rahnella perminowiae TaxID=2816244 RepID=A0ABS6KWC2_9GAMM|nr:MULTISPECIES: CidA/LrgA family protein [Rahnella]UJD88979.1 hypothetical protein FS594_09320 [Rahnella aquatilis]MBU9808535.1 CidA/LrgA family protein [Rahnella perminowiae]MBU9815554.1 CidA/LrgA family protein [Rahnella perminowiae]MBU9824076.1 CidA/LrgA family protein [Rahnella perminowiae]MBU9833325.1 CidA/LrgA family protein [Rahnella perminowiae]